MNHANLLALSLATALPALGQGRLTFLNTEAGTGVPGGVPATGADGVTRLTGASFWAQLYAAPGAGQPEGSLAAVGTPTNFRTGAGAGFVPAGIVVSIPGAAAGTMATVQMRVWEGSWSNYNPDGPRLIGMSNLITVGPLGGSLADGTPVSDPFLVGLRYYPIPEPSVAVLAIAGGLVVVLQSLRVQFPGRLRKDPDRYLDAQRWCRT
jgi:hypothetical protein